MIIIITTIEMTTVTPRAAITGFMLELDSHRFSIVSSRKSRDLFEVVGLVTGRV
jgi:hypothetical protein